MSRHKYIAVSQLLRSCPALALGYLLELPVGNVQMYIRMVLNLNILYQ